MDASFHAKEQAPSNLPLIVVSVVSLLLMVWIVAAEFLYWSADFIALLYMPIVLVTFVVSLFAQSIQRRLAPLAVCAATWLILWLVPFSKLEILANELNFRIYTTQREEHAKALLASKVQPDAFGLVDLHTSERGLSNGGGFLSVEPNHVAVVSCGGARCVLFFTYQRTEFRGTEGFLFVPDGGDPSKFNWPGEFHAKRYADHWYYVNEI